MILIRPSVRCFCRQRNLANASLREALEKKRADRVVAGRPRDATDVELHQWRQAQEQQVQERATQMELFAYPTNRRIPWVTLGFLAVSGSVTGYYKWYWKWVHDARSREEVEKRVDEFIGALEFAKSDLALASLVRMEPTATSCLYAASFFFASTLIERMVGPARLFALLASTTLVGNAAASYVEAPLSTSPAVVAVSVVSFVRFRRWAIWPGVPIPQFWLFAPLAVCELLALRRFIATRDVEEDRAATRQMHVIAAMDSIAQHSFERMEPVPDFGPVLEEVELTPQRDSAILADAAGLLLGLAAACV
eukprot:GEMP01068526.1.p1 GENE.GEMP01068526.1~~GEMP01068526.1.p1  ORF type:complete len:318 (+),score=76.27 GEMP01068526.1:31-954(+)